MNKFTFFWKMTLILLISFSVVSAIAQKSGTTDNAPSNSALGAKSQTSGMIEKAPVKEKLSGQQLKNLEQAGIPLKDLTNGFISEEEIQKTENLVQDKKPVVPDNPVVIASSKKPGKFYNPNESVTVHFGNRYQHEHDYWLSDSLRNIFQKFQAAIPDFGFGNDNSSNRTG